MVGADCLAVSGAGTSDSPFTVSPYSGCVIPIVCTSTTRPGSPTDGQLIYETDTDRVRAWSASANRWKIVNAGPVFTSYTGASGTTTGASPYAHCTATVSNPFGGDPFKIYVWGRLALQGTNDDVWDIGIESPSGNRLDDDRMTIEGNYGSGMPGPVEVTSSGSSIQVVLTSVGFFNAGNGTAFADARFNALRVMAFPN